MSLQSRFSHSLVSLPSTTQRIVIALSGGLDSSVLLHLAAQYHKSHRHLELLVVHVNHGLQEQANSWQLSCQQQAEALGLPFVAEMVDVEVKARSSLEAVAREKRYQALAKHMDAHSCLLTGHHADDQFETFMLALKRGSGLQGLAAMPQMRNFAAGCLLRPLLLVTRAELEGYAKQQQLCWIEDPSNQSLEFDRNFLRHKVLPELTERWPQWLASTQRSVQLLQESVDLLEELAESDYQTLEREQTLCCESLLLLSPKRQRNVLRYWFKLMNWAYPSQAQLAQIITQASAQQDAKVAVTLAEGQCRRFQACLYLVRKVELLESNLVTNWKLASTPILTLDNGSQLAWQNGGKLLPPSSSQQVSIKFRTHLEQKEFKAFGRVGSRSIKKLLQECKLPPWQRNRLPFVFYDEVLVAIADIYIQKDYACPNNTGIALNWLPTC
ncbi:tRNA lysidine(34) synthetase TilS [Agarivorans sp. B2Z047]|uniref:tRNA lysidine(34) synthetase TilS n=1 Tax=Agarivorans sp. B2Z047 TaxID=2652721 RepID=UPI00128E4CEA|nr:tRNA lysidine(34) synthetase TilS [Agarivorans sp. B2Z047]MPW27398.1 tRNA lysidine(34) synthetase TilS [Agarivorans sp. B2Z047]UQN44759.1 tRNA lysidine(34) synthetase TilS [Agarivorans sp. B2Z047]